MSDKKKDDKEGITDGDAIDYSPDFHEQEEDHSVEYMKKNNPGLYELMKKHGLEADEESAD